MKIKELLAKPEAWTKGAWARDFQNTSVHGRNPMACCWCLGGALDLCYNYEEQYAICKLIHNEACISLTIAEWNDAPERTHQEVLDLVTRLDV